MTEHPNWPANYGAWYVAKVLDALTANPDVWSRTVLFINYDENDGFFDHIVPPHAPTTPAQGASTTSLDGEIYTAGNGYATGPYGLGQRVPLLVVSPWSTGGWVCSEVFDHTSVLRFLERRFGVVEPHISPWRRAVCGDLTSAFDFSRTHAAPPRLPDTSGYAPPDGDRHEDYVPDVPADQSLPAQEHGVRAARPLPYDLAADATVGPGGRLRIDFASRGRAGANFLVTSVTDGYGRAHAATYRLRPAQSVVHTADGDETAGWYDLTVTSDLDAAYRRRAAGHAETGGASFSDPALSRPAGVVAG